SVKETGHGSFSAYVYENGLLAVFPQWIKALKAAKIEPPVFVALSMVGMNGKIPHLGPQYSDDGIRPIRHDPLLLQPRLIESLDDYPTLILRPIFDLVWNACGWPCSINFDENGDLRSR